jgi:hypothetical protein
VTLRARWVTLRARWVTLRARWVTLKVAGNFHLAPGKSFQQGAMHVHDLIPFKDMDFNISHTIHKLTFGADFPGVQNPMDGVNRIMGEGDGVGMYQYFIKVRVVRAPVPCPFP